VPPSRSWQSDALGRTCLRRCFSMSVAVSAGAALSAGCSGASPSTLSPQGPKAADVATLWWILFGVAMFVSLVVISMMMWAALFRRKNAEVRHDSGQRFVFVLGIVVPAAILAGTFGLSVGGIAGNAEPPRAPQLTVEVTGHRWWWEVRYPEAGVVTANEIHLPADTPVSLRLKAADVIHSFWVPELMPKVDLLPRRVNETWILVDRPGEYRGQCAEFCGTQHGHMAFSVVAEPRTEFRAWLQRNSLRAQEPATEEQRRGLEVLETTSCGTCHTVRGTEADGDVGPDLTHVASRDRLAAGAIPNTFGYMSGWVSNSQTVKPGNRMPPQQLSPRDLRAVVTYLQSLE
jgi:cytochrome c oxidase subunit II